jgi:hypothetical protein
MFEKLLLLSQKCWPRVVYNPLKILQYIRRIYRRAVNTLMSKQLACYVLLRCYYGQITASSVNVVLRNLICVQNG